MAALTAYGILGKFTWRMLATVLGGQAIVIFFGALVARGIAAAGDAPDRSSTYLWVGSGLALLALVAAGSMRRPYGVTLGWLVQLATLAAAVVVPMMLAVGLIFGALWILCLVQGDRIDRAQLESSS